MYYRIYSINRPGRLLNFWTLRVGAYSRWALIWGWALIKFSAFSASVVCLFCKNKTINGNDKTRRCNEARFLWNTLKKTPSWGKCLISTYSIFGGWVGGDRLFEFKREWEEWWGGRLFEAGRLLTFSAFRMGAYSRLGAYSNKYSKQVSPTIGDKIRWDTSGKKTSHEHGFSMVPPPHSPYSVLYRWP